MPKQPTQRTLEHLRKLGHPADVAEKWIPQTRRRKDLFGFIDVVAIYRQSICGIQCTSGSHGAARLQKIVTECRTLALEWLRHGTIEVWAWRKLKVKRGGKAFRWHPRIVQVTEADFPNVVGER